MYFCIDFFDKMTHSYDDLVATFESNLRKLMDDFKSLQEENSLLRERLSNKEQDVELLEAKFSELQKNYDHLRIAKTLAFSDEERNRSKQQINKLVREIDKCLALLLND